MFRRMDKRSLFPWCIFLSVNKRQVISEKKQFMCIWLVLDPYEEIWKVPVCHWLVCHLYFCLGKLVLLGFSVCFLVYFFSFLLLAFSLLFILSLTWLSKYWNHWIPLNTVLVLIGEGQTFTCNNCLHMSRTAVIYFYHLLSLLQLLGSK